VPLVFQNLNTVSIEISDDEDNDFNLFNISEFRVKEYSAVEPVNVLMNFQSPLYLITFCNLV
jgi:hypothetical protein